jgi:hypothetical protein
MRWMKRPAGCVAVLMALAGGAPSPVEAQTALTRQVMREKLTRSSQLLAALVTSNWVVLEREAAALGAVALKPGGDVLRAPEYVKQTGGFVRSVEALEEASRRRDQGEALAAYNGLVASCVECHRYVARARVALGPGIPSGRHGSTP